MPEQTTAMVLTGLDIGVIIAYLLLILGIGLLFGGRAGKSIEEYFVSGRSLPWWIAGTSMVATTFAADTPLAVCGIVIRDGIAGNWVWWAYAVGGMMTVFLYARLWRRSRVITDVEFIELRYSGPEASFLRGFRALYLAILMNCLIVGWVCNAMIKVLNVTLRPEEISALAPVIMGITNGLNGLFRTSWSPTAVSNVLMLLVLLGITGLFSIVSGLWGVSITDFIMFWIAIVGCVILAILAVDSVGGMQGLKSGLEKAYGANHDVLKFFPDFVKEKKLMPLTAFFVFIGVTWWASWYPGAEPGGGGYVVQRMASCKDEKHSLLATLWFTIAHYGIRPWPWIIVGLVAAVKFPDLLKEGADADAGFPRVMAAVLPAGLRGLLLVSFFAAFMSTISTQINWGSSYVVNDFYKRFIKPEATPVHYTRVSRIATFIILLLGTVVSFFITSVAGAWKLMLTIGAGTGLVFMLRWYWWRINAWSEISSMIASLAISLFLIYGFVYPMHSINYVVLLLSSLLIFFTMGIIALVFGAFYPQIRKEINVTTKVTIAVMGILVLLYMIYPVKLHDYHHILITAVSTIAVWLTVTLLTKPVEEKKLLAFYRQARPGGNLWGPIREKSPDVIPDRDIHFNILCWLLGTVAVYCFLFGVGNIVLGNGSSGVVLLSFGIGAAAGVYSLMGQAGWKNVLK
ncbi:Na+:solute symporter [Candidatus Sumerlaeota bacterium]|nr:Na+:solute symporter [Candidatus Sumerlaeota bacterium]